MHHLKTRQMYSFDQETYIFTSGNKLVLL